MGAGSTGRQHTGDTTMIAIETASPATLRFRRHATARTLSGAVTRALRAQVSGSVVARVVIDADTARTLAASGEIYQTASGEWMDAARRMAIEVRP
jgi:uncharacterized protein RhaS with RHS repeats